MAFLNKILKSTNKDRRNRQMPEAREKIEKGKVGTKKEAASVSYKNFIPGVLRSPRVTEKTNWQSGGGKYTFIVSRSSTKPMVKNAVEKMYGVKVKAINIIKAPSKKRRLGRIIGFTSAFKKAVVSLEKGQTIENL